MPCEANAQGQSKWSLVLYRESLPQRASEEWDLQKPQTPAWLLILAVFELKPGIYCSEDFSHQNVALKE